MAKIHIKSEKLTPSGGIFSGHGAKVSELSFVSRCIALFLITEKVAIGP